MSAKRRRERRRNRARRARRREEYERVIAAALAAMREATEAQRARLGPFIEMYGEESQALAMLDRLLLAQERREPLGVHLVAEGSVAPSGRTLRDLLFATERSLAMRTPT